MRSFPRRRDGSRAERFVLAGDRRNNLLTVESAVFDENLAGKSAADDYACDIHSGDVCFESLRVA